MRSQWLFTLLILVIGSFVLIHEGTNIPAPTNATNASSTASQDSMRMTANVVQSPSSTQGENWVLSKNKQGGYLATLYVDGRQVKLLSTRGTLKTMSSGTLYQTAGIVQFGKVRYNATQIYVPNQENQPGYIQLVRSTA